MRGYEIQHPPGWVLVTDHKCGQSGDGFCSYFNADALDMDNAGGIITGDEYICTGCNNTITKSDVEFASEDEVEADRKAADPDYQGSR